MKYLIAVLLLVTSVSAHAQITLEHTFPNARTFALMQIDSNQWKYVETNIKDSIWIYNLDHSLEQTIIIPSFHRQSDAGAFVVLVAKRLFNMDGSYGYLLWSADSLSGGTVRIYQDDGTPLFSCEDCQLDQPFNTTYFAAAPVIATDSGTKMLIQINSPPSHQVYSLPGKLPGCSTALLGVNPPNSIGTDPAIPTSAYPNPSQGRVRISYQLPPGVSSGEVVLTDEEGREVKRYRVTNAFSDLEIQESDLPSGSYFYRVVTSKGESAAARIVLDK